VSLPQTVLAFLTNRAQKEGKDQPPLQEDLFDAGILDSFSVVELVSLVEQDCRIAVPDGDVPENFRSIAKIESYIASKSA